MKIIGLVLLTAAAAAIGVFKASELKKSVALLSELIAFLELMRNEICSRRTPMKQLLSANTLPEYKYIQSFTSALDEQLKLLGNISFFQIWTECVNEYILLISQESRRNLINLGSSLGRYDAQLQATAIDRCISELEREYKSLCANMRSNQKMYIGLGTGMGLIVSIILI